MFSWCPGNLYPNYPVPTWELRASLAPSFVVIPLTVALRLYAEWTLLDPRRRSHPLLCQQPTLPENVPLPNNPPSQKACSSDDDEHQKLQMEYELVVEENRRLKQKTQKVCSSAQSQGEVSGFKRIRVLGFGFFGGEMFQVSLLYSYIKISSLGKLRHSGFASH